MKKLIVLMLAIVAGFAFSIGGNGFGGVKRAHAAGPSEYQYTYSSTNFYAENALFYAFSFLDVTTTYVWTIYKADDNLNKNEVITTWISFGTATFNPVYGAGAFNSFWPEDYTGPIIIEDNFGQLIGKHFISPTPGNDWITSSGVTSENQKQAPGVPVHSGDCRAAPYRNVNSDGYHHSFQVCSQQVTRESYFLLHYRMDLAEYGNGDTIVFNPMGSGVAEITLNIDEMVDYNYGGYPGGLSEANTWSFVVVNTGNGLLPFVDYNLSQAAFSTVANDPHWASNLGVFGLGAYNCKRFETGPTLVSDCESVLLVSNQYPQTRFDGAEFQITAAFDPVESGDTQRATQRMFTEEIFDVYNSQWIVTDAANTVNTDVPGAFTTDPIVFEYVSTAVGVLSFINLVWSIYPDTFSSLAMSSADARFIVFDVYVASPDPVLGTGIIQLIKEHGFGTEKGFLFLNMLVWIIGLAITGIFFGKNWLAHLVVFTFIGGIFWQFDLMSGYMKLLYSASSFFLWIFYFGYVRQGTGEIPNA